MYIATTIFKKNEVGLYICCDADQVFPVYVEENVQLMCHKIPNSF